MNNIEKQHNSKIYIKQNDINKYIYNKIFLVMI